MKARDIVKKATTPRIKVPIVVNEKDDFFEFPQLTVSDWKEIKLECDREKALLVKEGLEDAESFDMWAMLLDISSGMDETLLKGKSKAQREEMQRRTGMEMFEKVGHGIQLSMFFHSVKHDEPEITKDEIDKLISYCLPDRGAYFRALTFFIYGVNPDDIVKAKETEESADSPLELKDNTDLEEGR